MKFSINSILQLIGLSGQVINQVGGLVPVKYRGWVAGALAIMQGVAGILAHFSNPDGTSASTAYVAPK